MPKPSKVTRRKFLQLTGATGAIGISAALGYGLLKVGEGEFPPSISPYAVDRGFERLLPSPTPDAPLLVLVNEGSHNPFGFFLAEILCAEGLNCFQIAWLGAADTAYLDQFDLILLAEGPLDRAQVDLLAGYVARGGRLVAMRPDARLASVFGVEPMAGHIEEGYVQVDTGHRIGQGIASATLQFHGVADRYQLAGAQVVAWLASAAATRTDFPAVTVHRYGQGQAALWAFDLARSVVYTRQGNPAWVNEERDGLPLIRAVDMFRGWVDLDRVPIPQADEQQRLLANLLTTLSQERKPLPRLWYFPAAADGMLIATGDAHASPAVAIEGVLARVEERGGHMSVYYAPGIATDWRRSVRNIFLHATDLPLLGQVLEGQITAPTLPQVAAWRARGHEFALHPYVDTGLEPGWHYCWKEFTGAGYGPVSRTTRTHAILWTGWVETARVQASYGIGMNLDYYHVGPAFQRVGGEGVYGHFTGSGLPMRMVDEEGRILNIYQQLTQLADEHLIEMPWAGSWPKLSVEAAMEVSRSLLNRAVGGGYAAVAAQFHLDPFAVGGQWAIEAARWLEGTLDCAATLDMPIWSAAEWLNFSAARHDAVLANIQWWPTAGRLSCRLVVRQPADVMLTILFPQEHGAARLAHIEVDGRTLEHHERRVGGIRYGGVSVQAGNRQIAVTYA